MLAFHGTKKYCSNLTITCESLDQCSLCSILRKGFLKRFIGANSDLRYGKGFYFSSEFEKSL